MTSATGLQCSVRVIRKLRGLSSGELAERIRAAGCQVTDSHIRAVELGHKAASEPLMAAWATALQVERLDLWQPPTRTARKAAARKGAAA